MPSIYSMSTLQLAYSWLTAYTGSKLRRRSSTDIEAEPFTGAVDELSCQKIRKLGNGISSPCPLRIMSASCPHHIRIISASYPHHVRIISASYPHHIIQKEVTPFISHSLGISHPKSLHTTTSNPIPSHLHTCTPLHTSTACARAFTTTNLHFLLTSSSPLHIPINSRMQHAHWPFFAPLPHTFRTHLGCGRGYPSGAHFAARNAKSASRGVRVDNGLRHMQHTCSTRAAHTQAHMQHTCKHTRSTHASTHAAHMQHTCSTHAAHMQHTWSTDGAHFLVWWLAVAKRRKCSPRRSLSRRATTKYYLL